MSKLKFYTDTHIDKQVAIQLRQRGVDVVRCEEVNMAEADDERILNLQHVTNWLSSLKMPDFVPAILLGLRQGKSTPEYSFVRIGILQLQAKLSTRAMLMLNF